MTSNLGGLEDEKGEGGGWGEGKGRGGGGWPPDTDSRLEDG